MFAESEIHQTPFVILLWVSVQRHSETAPIATESGEVFFFEQQVSSVRNTFSRVRAVGKIRLCLAGEAANALLSRLGECNRFLSDPPPTCDRAPAAPRV